MCQGGATCLPIDCTCCFNELALSNFGIFTFISSSDIVGFKKLTLMLKIMSVLRQIHYNVTYENNIVSFEDLDIHLN